VYVNGSVTSQFTNGLNAALDTIRTPGVFKTADRDGFKKADVYIKAGYDRNRWKGSVSYKKTNQQADIDGGAYNDDDNNYVDFERDMFQYQAEYQLNKAWQVGARGSWSESERINEDDSSKIDTNNSYDGSYFYGNYSGKLLTNEIQGKYRYKTIDGVLGMGLYDEDMHFDTYFFSNAFGPFELITDYDSLKTSAKTRYAFGQINWSHNQVSLSAGLRLSDHERFGNAVTFEINPSYRFENFILFASVSSGYNAPSLYQLFDPTQDFGAFTDKGNEDLKPEKSLSVEVGVKKEFSSGSYFTVSAFHTRVKNSIEYIYLWNQNTAVPDLDYTDYLGDTYLNITEQRTSGVELEAHVKFFERLYLTSNFTWNMGELNFNPAAIDQQQTGGNHVQLFNYGVFVDKVITNDELVRRPRIMGLAEIGYSPLKNLSASIIYRYSGSRPDSQYDYTLGPFGALGQSKVSSYQLVDFNVHYQLSGIISLGARIENLFDSEYQEIIGFQTRGRSAYVKVGMRW
jgi:vitamin B12 transporter